MFSNALSRHAPAFRKTSGDHPLLEASSCSRGPLGTDNPSSWSHIPVFNSSVNLTQLNFMPFNLPSLYAEAKKLTILHDRCATGVECRHRWETEGRKIHKFLQINHLCISLESRRFV